jgi:3-carboxy-cis,cis-muconate cycloisomerase
LQQASADALVLQFGGATGTLAALGDQGAAVAEALAAELELPLPDAPWHTHRDRLATLVCACGVLVGSLGKIAHDISLLSQSEVAEVSEPGGEGRGASSAMPQKRNPVGCVVALAAATQVPALVSSYLSAMVQEHERAAGGSQAEWPIIAEIIQATGAATNAMAEVAEGLTVDPARMRKNLESTMGTVFAEKAAVLLASKVGRSRAHKLLEEVTRRALAQHKSLTEALREMREVKEHLDQSQLKALEIPEEYLGSAEWFRRRLLESFSARSFPQKKD